ncbi:hypothetical protein E2C01_099744 [Portunus trituberculatus]|uniref:Uncharacterized protein n=1 Tax=Portunus trituberculatus TaxID=210409 RepID=A0A5B7KHM0_PORTR|nr:hypothetical protein [Portunus trituberculatus]
MAGEVEGDRRSLSVTVFFHRRGS